MNFAHLTQLDEIKKLAPVEFERFVGSLFEQMGYAVNTTAVTGDEGVDLVLRKDEKTSIVQCKRYDGTVSSAIVRELYGSMVHNRALSAYLVTTGAISLPAQQWASGKSIHLIDGSKLVQWIESSSKKYTLCPKCSTTNLRDNYHCSKCGSRLAKSVHQQHDTDPRSKNIVATLITCVHCGEDNLPNKRYCAVCSEKLPTRANI